MAFYKAIRDVWAITSRVPLSQAKNLMDGIVMSACVLPIVYDVKGMPDETTEYLSIVLVPHNLTSSEVGQLFEDCGPYSFRKITSFLEVHHNG